MKETNPTGNTQNTSGDRPKIAMYFGDGRSCPQTERPLWDLMHLLGSSGVDISTGENEPVENILFAGCARSGPAIENRIE